MCRWRRACALVDLDLERGHVVEVDGRLIAFFRHGEAVRALAARCPHAAGPLGRGWIEAEEVVCPLHRWRFRLDDGRCTTVADVSVHIYRCEVSDGDVWVEV